jgi:hypothetical protein
MSDIVPFRQEIDRVRTVLIEGLGWSPLDFVREIDRQGDKRLYIDSLTRETDEDNDLRFVHHGIQGPDLFISAERLPWDSRFFGFGVARLNGIFPLEPPFFQPYADYASPVHTLLETAGRRGISYVFAQVDARDLALMRALGQASFALVETRLYYHASLKEYDRPERYAVRAATPDDVDTLGRVARDMVNLYDRFHADPFLAGENADRLMHKWVEASILEDFADITLVPDVPRPAAFITLRYHRDKWSTWGLRMGQPVFGAVSPEFRGWYRKLISEINWHLKEAGVEHTYLTTQITNKAVMKVWERFGYHFGRGEYVFRKIL